MVGIYREVYADHHYLIGLALSNLASVYLERKEYTRAEQLYREVIRRYTETLSPGHLNTAIARLKLGRALRRQRRYPEAEESLLASYDTMNKQASPSVSWLQSARKELATLYDAMNEPEKAKKFRAELGGGKK